MLQLKYRDYKEITQQDLICTKMRLQKKPIPKAGKNKNHYLDQLALPGEDLPLAMLYSLLEEDFHKQFILCSAGAFLSCIRS